MAKNKKKSIPLGIRKVLEELTDQSNGVFMMVDKRDAIIRFEDVDRDSGFYFEVEKINVDHNRKRTTYTIGYLPSKYENLTAVRQSVGLQDVKPHFKKWINLMKEMNEPSPLFDDLITQSYYDELEPDFEIIDKDSDQKPFSINQQRLILAYLEKAEEILKTENENPDTKELLVELDATKSILSKSTKKEIIKRIRKIIAKGYRVGLKVGEKLLIEFTSELAKKMIQGS